MERNETYFECCSMSSNLCILSFGYIEFKLVVEDCLNKILLDSSKF